MAFPGPKYWSFDAYSFDSRLHWLVFPSENPVLFPAVSILTCDRAHGLSPCLDNLTSMTLLPHGDRGTGSFRRDISIGSNNCSTCLHWGLYETHRDWWIVSQTGCALTSGSLALTQKLPSVIVSGGLVAGWPIVGAFLFEVEVQTLPPRRDEVRSASVLKSMVAVTYVIGYAALGEGEEDSQSVFHVWTKKASK